MVDSVMLYISAADDLQIEKDLLARSVAEIPVTLGWQIFHSPNKEKQLNLDAITKADFHILILGEDIRAPIGYEWYISRQVGRKPIAFLKNGIPRTPAAHYFRRSISDFTSWKTYKNLSDLHIQAFHTIGQHLLKQASYFTLNQIEMEKLSNYIRDLENAEPENIMDSQGGAGENSVILSRERFIPKDGVLIQAPPKSEQENS
ncbi:hypothetical protein ACFLY4_03840 [Chloroflexota bacterium]